MILVVTCHSASALSTYWNYPSFEFSVSYNWAGHSPCVKAYMVNIGLLTLSMLHIIFYIIKSFLYRDFENVTRKRILCSTFKFHIFYPICLSTSSVLCVFIPLIPIHEMWFPNLYMGGVFLSKDSQ